MKPYLIILLSLTLVGCATTSLNPSINRAETKLTHVAALPVRAAPAVWTYSDEFSAAGFPFRNETGKSFVLAFAGTKADMPLLEILSSNLSAETQSLGFAIEFKYDVRVRLTRDGKSEDFEAHAVYRATGFTGPDTAAKIVTEDAIAQLVEKVRASLAR